jgi:hypothetical protein
MAGEFKMLLNQTQRIHNIKYLFVILCAFTLTACGGGSGASSSSSKTSNATSSLKAQDVALSQFTIVNSPVSVNVTKRESISLSVKVSGAIPVSYQWIKDNKNISGATSPNFVVNSAALSDKGMYSVKITSSLGSKTTLPVSVTVHDFDAQLSWSAPMTRADGSALTSSEIAGYVIRYGVDPSKLDNTVTVTASTLSKSFLNMTKTPNTTYYFEIAALDTNGLQSDYSQPVSKTFL